MIVTVFAALFAIATCILERVAGLSLGAAIDKDKGDDGTNAVADVVIVMM